MAKAKTQSPIPAYDPECRLWMNSRDLANLLGITTPTVVQLRNAHRAACHKAGKGWWYWSPFFLEVRRKDQQAVGGTDWDAEYKKARAEMAMLELEEKRRNLISVDEVREVFNLVAQPFARAIKAAQVLDRDLYERISGGLQEAENVMVRRFNGVNGSRNSKRKKT